jgi:hypothetical protein
MRDLPRASAPWALDSGGFTEIATYGGWRTDPVTYADEVERFAAEVGRLAWVAPQDWMCEPAMLARTGLTVRDHQERTVGNFRLLRQLLGALVIPVLQGYTLDEYLACWDEYAEQGVNLEDEPVVGLGSVCRRQNMAEAGRIVQRLAGDGLRLHAFGVKLTGLESFGDLLTSSDSMAWSRHARNRRPLPGCRHRNCANCLRYALRWRNQIDHLLNQQRMEIR